MGRSVTEVEAAQRRATISAFLRNNPGPHKVQAIATHASVTPRTAGQILRHLSETGLIAPPVGSPGNKRYSWKNGDGAPAAAPAPVAPAPVAPVVATPAAAPAARAPRAPVGAGVELLVGGTLLIVGPGQRVIVGRNEQSGRTRVMLEDAP